MSEKYLTALSTRTEGKSTVFDMHKTLFSIIIFSSYEYTIIITNMCTIFVKISYLNVIES